MPTRWEEWRATRPQYNDVDDDTLAEARWKRYYEGQGVSLDEYRQHMGLPSLEPEPDPEPTIGDRLDRHLGETSRAQDPLSRDDMVGQMLELASDPHGELQTWFRYVEEAQERGTVNNTIRKAAERGTALVGHAVRGVIGTPGEALGDWAGSGQIVFGTDWGEDHPDDGKFRVRWMNRDEYDDFRTRHEVRNVFSDTIPDYLTSRQFGYVPRHTTEVIKRAYT